LPHSTWIATLEHAALSEHRVVALHGVEAMNALSSWTVRLVGPEPIDAGALVRQGVVLHLVDREEGSERALHLVVVGVEHEGADHGVHRHTIELAPPEQVRTLREGFRIFVDQSAKDVVEAVLAPHTKTEWRLSGACETRPQCVQYGETEWAFVERLLADEGIAYWFESTDDGSLLVFGDAKGAHATIDEPRALALRNAAGMVGLRHFSRLEAIDELCASAYHVRDVNLRQPEVMLEGKAGKGPLEVFEHPARVSTVTQAKARADVRLEQVRRDAKTLAGASDCSRLVPGRVVEIAESADEDGQFLIVALEHVFHGDVYGNHVKMVPFAGTYRPAIPRSSPRVPGWESAITTGPAGEEIHVDDLGRTKVRFPWDRSARANDDSSAWVRCLQMGMGGAMVLPRVGWEVPVAYMYGDPDRPVVLGRVYNGTQIAPYPLPNGKATTTFQSATSPSDGTTHEIRLNDAAGKQEVFVHATKDQTVEVGTDATTTILGNETHDVGLSHEITVGGVHAHSVGASQSVDVGTIHALAVKKARIETIGQAETIQVGGNRSVSTPGAYTESIGASHALLCNQDNTKVEGAFTQTIGADLNVAAALGVGESCAAARTEKVGGARTIACGTYAEEVTGAKSITAGAASDKAGQKVVTYGKAKGSVKAQSMSLSAAGPVVVSASEITIDVAGSIQAGALSLAGGTMNASSGATKLKGTISRKGQMVIE
jgi:type VI secretion system secreted protein VgrG